MAEQAASSIKAYMDFLINDALVTAATNPALLSDNPDEVQSVIKRMHDRLDVSPGSLIISKLDKNGNVLMEFPEPSNANEKNIQGAGFMELGDREEIKQVIESHQATVSGVFLSTEGITGEGSEGRQGVSILVPLFRGDEFIGILRTVIFINETLVRQFISPLRFGKEGHGHLLIGETLFAVNPSPVEDDFFSNPSNLKMLNDLKAGKPGFILQTYNFSSGQGMTKEEEILVYYPVRALDKNWGVVIESPAEEAYLSLTKSMNRLWLFTFLTVIFIIIMGAASSFFLTRNLRKEVLDKTKEIREINLNLEKVVQKRTKELEQLNRELEERVNARTKDINKKVKELTDTKTAVLNILEDVNLSKDDLEKSHVDLLKLNKNMEKANVELKKSEEYKNQFISITAHELKTPLASIHGFAGLLQNKKILSNPKQRNYYLDIIQEDSERLKKLIDDILDLSRLDIGTMKFYFEKVDIKEIFKELVKEMYILATKNKLALNASVAANVPEMICDKSRLTQVLVNLVNNAIKYTPKRGGKIHVYVVKKGNMIQFSVKDTGIGIPRSAYHKLFQRFFQVDSWLTRKVGGSGLGLSISRGIVEALGGKIWFESKINKGSTFFFTLPVKPKSAAEEQDLKVIKTQVSVPSPSAPLASAPLNPSSSLSPSNPSNSRIKKPKSKNAES
jgi:signal transduction histidine kinase